MKWRVFCLVFVVGCGGGEPELPEVDLPTGVEEVYVESAQPSSASSYDVGYEQGRRAFLLQMGEEVPVVEMYVSHVDLDEEEVSRGYVDGYHKAGEQVYCPCPRSF